MKTVCSYFFSAFRRFELAAYLGCRSAGFLSILIILAAALPSAQAIPVTVIDPGQPPLPLSVELTNDIQDVKQQIFDTRGYPVVQQVLVYKERRLPDSSSIADHCISTNDVLYLTLDSGLALKIESISAPPGMVELVATQMTAGITQIVEHSPSLQSNTVWSNALASLATSSGTNWTLAMPANGSSFYRVRELDPNPPVTEYPGYELVWSDEFNGSAIDTNNWWHQQGDGTLYGSAPGWGNAELQIYTNAPENSRIVTDCDGNSALLIEARQGAASNDYTSAKLVTDGLQSFRYGRIEARIKLPYSKGAWPAFWLLGTNQPVVGWPGCGEIDIIELLGGEEDTIYGSLHYVSAGNLQGGSSGAKTLTSGLYSDDYHIYGIDWTPSNMTFQVDGVAYHTAALTDDMKEYQRSFYLILNLAVGGFWPGYPDATSVFPMRMLVDYVRVYRDLNLVDPGEPPLDIAEETMGQFGFEGSAAIQDGFAPFASTYTWTYGGGAPSDVVYNTNAVDGALSIDLTWNGGSFGGVWWQIVDPSDLTNPENVVPTDMSAYAGGNLVFAIQFPPEVEYHFLVKMESGFLNGGPNGRLNLLDYTPVPIGGGFMEYTIPVDDFVNMPYGVDLSQVIIPFALWSPESVPGSYYPANVVVDNIHFTLP